jgi:hypothetical protein
MKLKIIRPFYRLHGEEYSKNQLEQIRTEGFLDGISYNLDSGDPNFPVNPVKLSRGILSYSVPYILRIVSRCNETNDSDAIVIMGFLDPGFHEARELSKIPVIGACHSAVHLASIIKKIFYYRYSGLDD